MPSTQEIIRIFGLNEREPMSFLHDICMIHSKKNSQLSDSKSRCFAKANSSIWFRYSEFDSLRASILHLLEFKDQKYNNALFRKHSQKLCRENRQEWTFLTICLKSEKLNHKLLKLQKICQYFRSAL